MEKQETNTKKKKNLGFVVKGSQCQLGKSAAGKWKTSRTTRRRRADTADNLSFDQVHCGAVDYSRRLTGTTAGRANTQQPHSKARNSTDHVITKWL